MILSQLTWQDVSKVSRDAVVLIPTGSLEQHGPHLPLFTDSILVTAVAEAVEKQMVNQVLLTPTLWLGASGHHLAMNGTLSASFSTYMGAIRDVIHSLAPHGFIKFFILNGHGGNTEPNGMVMRELKAEFPSFWLGHSGYFAFATEVSAQVMTGPAKEIRHACEAEVSLMLHVRPELVRKDKLRDDGLAPEPPIVGMIHTFDEMTEEGSLGYATHATAEKGKAIFDAAVQGVCANLATLANGYALKATF